MTESLFYEDRQAAREALETSLKKKVATGMYLYFCGNLEEKIELTSEEFLTVSRWTGKSPDPNLNKGEWWLENIFKQGEVSA